MKQIQISIVIPAYNEEENILLLYNKLTYILNGLKKSYEIIFVDDGSTDNTFNILKKLNEKDKNLRIIQLQTNFEKAAALSAGFSKSRGNTIITLDSDLQDDPDEIPQFLKKLDEGHDLVVGWRYKRKDKITKKIASKIFNFFIRRFMKIKLHDSDCNFKAMKKEVIKNINLYSGLYRYVPSLADSKGYRVTEIKITHNPRMHGRSKYGFERLHKGFMDLITMVFLLSYNKRPLHLFGSLGAIFSILGLLTGFYLLYIKYFFSQLIGDRPLLILSFLLIVLGIQFFSIGLIGEMIANTHQKPNEQYIIKKEL